MSNEDIKSASRALKDAAAAFSRALGQTLSDAGTQAGKEIADELQLATRELNDAVTKLGRERPGPRTSPKVERTRADLLAAARKVFAAQGYEGSSVGDVAAAAGYTKGAVYANFGSKEELFVALAREVTDADTHPVEHLSVAELVDTFGRCPQSEDDVADILLTLEFYVYAIRHADARAEFAELARRSYDQLARLVHRARSGDDGRGPTQEDRDTAYGLAAVHTMTAILTPLLADEDETAATTRRLVERLLED